MSTDPKITLTVPGSVLVGMHHIGTRTLEAFDAETHPTQAAAEARSDLRDVVLAISGALRAHGYRQVAPGMWERTPSRGRPLSRHRAGAVGE